MKNTRKIDLIVMKPTTRVFCPLGKDWYTAKLTVTVVRPEDVPDYCDVEEWMSQNVREKAYIIEDVVGMVYQYVKDVCKPESVEVRCDVTDSRVHFPVTVIKQ